MSSFTGIPNVGDLIPSIENAFIKFGEIPTGRKTCDVCGDLFSITGDLDDCPVGLPCLHVHCFGCTRKWLHKHHSCPECGDEYHDIRPICATLEREAYLCRYQYVPPSGQSEVRLPPSSSHVAANSLDPRGDDTGMVGVGSQINLGIGTRTEGIEGATARLNLGTAGKGAFPTPNPYVHSVPGTLIQKDKFEMPLERSKSGEKSYIDGKATYEQILQEETDRKEKGRAYRRNLRAQETPRQRRVRLQKRRLWRRESLAKETEEQRTKRLETAKKYRLTTRLKRQGMDVNLG